MDAVDASRCALVLVDYQAKLIPAIHGAQDVVRHAVLLADAARVLGIRVIGTEQNPKGLGPNVDDVRVRCETTLAKMQFDACEDGLVAELDRGSTAAPDVVIGGCDSGVANVFTSTAGCTRSDHVRRCAAGAANHGGFVSCVAHYTNAEKGNGTMSGREHAAITSCAAKSN